MKISEIVEEYKALTNTVLEYKNAICRVIGCKGSSWLEDAKKDLRVSTQLLVTEYEKSLKKLEDFSNRDMVENKKNNPLD